MGIKIISENRKARFNFEIMETFEAGLVLKGSEVKSLRSGSCTIKEAYISDSNGELFLQNCHIGIYEASSYNNHSPNRLRKLLLHKKEVIQILTKVTQKGFSCVPLKMYFKNGRAKVLVGLAKGKKSFDKRESIKKREVNRELSRMLKKTRS